MNPQSNFPPRAPFGPQGGQVQQPIGAQIPQQQPPMPFAPNRPAAQPFVPQVPQAPFQQPQPNFAPAFRGPPQGQQQRAQAAQPRNANPFAGVEQVKAQTDSNYARSGGYIIKLDEVKHFVGHNDGLNKVLIKKTVLGIVAPAEDGHTHVVGEQIVHLIKEDPRYNYFKAEVKAFVAVLLGMPEQAVTEAIIWEALTSGALHGLVAEVQNRLHATARSQIVRKNYMRRVRSNEIPQIIAPEVVARYFPNGTLERMAQVEAQEAAHFEAQQNQQPSPQAFQQPQAQQYAPPPPQGWQGFPQQ
jgi:hypothetical protein